MSSRFQHVAIFWFLKGLDMPKEYALNMFGDFPICSVFVMMVWSFYCRFEVPFWSIFVTQIDQTTHFRFLLLVLGFVPCVFKWFCVLGGDGGCYARLILVPLSVRVLHLFLIVFCSELCYVLETKSVILGIDFWMNLAYRPKSLKSGQERSKSGQERPKSAQERPKSAPERRAAQERHQSGQE